MGGQTFWQEARGKTAREAFNAAREQALHEHGHGGYTGSIAEKHDFVMIVRTPGCTPMQQANYLIDSCDARIDDKFGPAGCIQIEPERWLFFGWASS